MILSDDIVKKLENERDSWSMRAFSEDSTMDGSDYLTGYYLGFANGLNAAIQEIRPSKRPGSRRKGKKETETTTALRLI